MVTKAHTQGHKRCNHRHNHTVTTMHIHTQTQTKKYRILVKEQLSHTHRATQMPGSHADPIAYITRHNHQHKTQTHAQDSSESPAPAHMRAHTATVTQTPGHTLSHLPIACFPLPPMYHTQSRRHPQSLQTDRAALRPWGAAPHPQPESWSLGGHTQEREAAHCLWVGPLPGSWAAPGTLDQAFGGCLKFPYFIQAGWVVESQAQGPCFEKGVFLGHRPRIAGVLCSGRL